MKFLVFSTFASLCLSAPPQINLNDGKQVSAAAKQMAALMMDYFNRGKVQAADGKGPEGFQWYEGGLFHSCMMEYIKASGDTTHANTIVNALTKESSGSVGNFLGTNRAISALAGKWNDDLLWWSFGAVTGAEVFGKDVMMPGGVSYLTLAVNTYQDTWDQWDSACSGGIYWIRSSKRDGKNANGQSYAYKSSITNIEQLGHAARLAVLTGNKTFLAHGDQIYNWFKNTGLITRNNEVLDGIDADGGKCLISAAKYTYNTGMLAGSLGALFNATKNQVYLDAAHNIFKSSLTTFTRNNIIYELCEPNRCAENSVTHKGVHIRGLGELYEYTTDQNIKNQIKQILQSTLQAMIKTCDEKWNCGGTYLVEGPPAKGSNIHFTINAMELMTAYLKTFATGVKGGLAAPTKAGAATDNGPPVFNPNGSAFPASRGFGVLVFSLIVTWFLF